jgi:uncharacterized protein YyaL (SSP411 family)
MPNRLALETSPYLLQHRDNPVDWYPWGPEAIERARREDKPIFVSIGYSACHWCHVMEHESFEDPEIARLLNERFVCIKVDREERPDLDQIYMNAVQLLTGRGGWPMSVFLTPSLEPFYGGTYWPPRSSRGMPGFDQIVRAVSEAWKSRREQAVEGAARLKEQIQQAAHVPWEREPLTLDLLSIAVVEIERSFDHQHGGFGDAPKFPHAMDLQVMLRQWRRQPKESLLQMVRLTLDKMAAGGIYDHLGGGFARYSVDARWLVPHFEKMLYDNALLAGVYLDGYLATGDENDARIVRETLDYVLRDMTDPLGGFYSTEDADSEGEEGRFYVWTPAELAEILGPQAAETFAYVYDVSDIGNFEGKNILNLPKTLAQCARILNRDEHSLASELADGRAKLLAVRNQRVRPGRDDKVLVSWNGLMIDALARAAGALGEPRYLQAASKATQFILRHMRRADGRLLHTWRAGHAKLDAYLDDYASLVYALLTVYEASFDEQLIDEAVCLTDTILELFTDPAGGAYFYTASDHEPLIARHKEMTDGSVPSSNGMLVAALLRLGKLCGSRRYLDAAESILDSASGVMRRFPTAVGQMLLALDMHLGPTPEIVLVGASQGSELDELLADLHRRFLPNKVIAARQAPDRVGHQSAALDPIFEGKPAARQVTLYVCDNFACQSPVHGKDAILAHWQSL